MSEENEDRQEFHSYAFSISTAEEILSQHKPNEMDEIERRIESDPEPAIFKYYIRFQFWKPGPYIVCLWWFGILLLGAFYGRDLLNLTIFSFAAPSGTDGYTADAKMDDLFPDRINSRQLLLYFECHDCGPSNMTTNTSSIQWAPEYSHQLYTNQSYDGWIMNEMGKDIVDWAKGQKPKGIFLGYTDFYQSYFSYGITPNDTLNVSELILANISKLFGQPKNLLLSGLASEIFVSQSLDSAIGLLSYDNTKDQTDKNNFIDNLKEHCKEVSDNYGGGKIKVSMTGESALIKDMNAESRKDVERKDTLTIPLALCVLALIIRSWRLMFIPLVTFLVSICASFSVMRPFAEGVLDVNPFCPSIMMSVTIAMSIDYSLFLLSRYREEVERNTEGVHNLSKERMIEISRDAIRQTTRWSGKVIALSGCILSLTYFGLIFYPMEVLQSVGLGAGLAIVCTILVNLTLTPAILLIFPYFFSQFGWAGCPCQYMKCCKKGDGSNGDSCWKSMNEPLMVNDREPLDNNNDIISRDVLDNSNNRDIIDMEDRVSNVYADSISQPFDRSGVDLYAAVNKDDPCEKCWYHCGSKTTVCPWSILISVVVYAAIAPIGWQFTTFQQQLADTLVFPRDSDYYTTYNDVVADFSAGFIAPWYILIMKKDNQSKISSTEFSEYMNETGALIEQIFNNATINGGYDLTIEGLGFIGSTSIGLGPEGARITEDIWNNNISCVAPDWAPSSAENTIDPMKCWEFTGIPTKKTLLEAESCYNCSQANGTYQFIQLGKISEDRSAAYYQMTTEFDPYYKHAIDFVGDFRGYVSSACDKWEYDCYLSGGSIDEVDSVKKIYDNFPTVLGCIVAFVFCLMGLVFKSVFVPFRLFITIAVPMTFVYGLAVMTYQHGMLSGLNIDAFANTDGLYWLIPVMTVTILIGLALDYDIFLFARIYEYRVMGGVPTHEAIIRGVYKTGSIITAAGIIMGIAFCGLLLSKITSLNQTGFIMVIAVLVDTFIIRTSLVPAVLSIAKEVNWWPGLNPKCKSQEALRNDMEIRMNSSKHVNSNYSINNSKPLRTGNLNDNTLDETM